MIFSLKNVSHVAVRGLEVELHFKDTSSHLRRFASVEAMIDEITWWRTRTAALEHPYASPLIPLPPTVSPDTPAHAS